MICPSTISEFVDMYVNMQMHVYIHMYAYMYVFASENVYIYIAYIEITYM